MTAYLPGPQSPQFYAANVHLGDQAGDYRDLESAVAALDAIRQPGEWGRVTVRDGTYVQKWGAPDKVAVQAMTPGRVIVERPIDATFSAIDTFGGTYLLSGVHFRLPNGFAGSESGVYALHAHFEGGPAVWDQCIFESLSTSRDQSAGADTIGIALTTFNASHFRSTTNFHGAGTNNRPARLVLRDTVVDGNTGYNGLSSGQADEMWVVGGNVSGALTLAGAGVHGIIDQAACPTVYTSDGATFDWYDPEVHILPPVWDVTPT